MNDICRDNMPHGRTNEHEYDAAINNQTLRGNSMTEAASTTQNKETKQPKVNGKPQAKQQRVISDPKEVAQLVMMRIDQVNSKKDELTIAAKGLADTAKQLVSVYAKQQAQLAKLAKRVEELEKAGNK